MLILQVVACSSRTAPAPVTTLDLRENFYQQRNRGSLNAHTYTVQRGDTLYSIAFRAGKDVRELAAINNIASPYTIYPQQKLRLGGKVALNHKKSTPSVAQVENTKPAPSKKTPTIIKATPSVKPAPVQVVKNTSNQSSSQTKSNSSVKPVASENQKSYGQTVAIKNKKSADLTPNVGLVQWQWPVKGKIISGFSHKEQGNKGVDISGAEGNRVNAAASGQVVYAGNALRGYGNLIIIKHNDDYLSAYAHNRKMLVAEKQMVMAGQQIAELGSTDATDARLHFEIRYRGSSVDPLKYLPK